MDRLPEQRQPWFLYRCFEQLFRGYSEGILNSQESLWEIAFNPTGAGYKDNAGTWATYNGPAVEAPGKNAPADAWGRANAFFRVLPAWKNFFEEGVNAEM